MWTSERGQAKDNFDVEAMEATFNIIIEEETAASRNPFQRNQQGSSPLQTSLERAYAIIDNLAMEPEYNKLLRPEAGQISVEPVVAEPVAVALAVAAATPVAAPVVASQPPPQPQSDASVASPPHPSGDVPSAVSSAPTFIPSRVDAMSYLSAVRARFPLGSPEYTQLMSIFQSFKAGKLSNIDATSQVTQLFQNEPDLLQGFSLFVPIAVQPSVAAGRSPLEANPTPIVQAPPPPAIEVAQPPVAPAPKPVAPAVAKSAPVDAQCRLKDSSHVYCDSDGPWDATLTQSNEWNRKFYILQVLESNSILPSPIAPFSLQSVYSRSYWLWLRWGRPGSVGQSSLQACQSLGEALTQFRIKFQQKTSQPWNQKPFIPIEGKYTLVTSPPSPVPVPASSGLDQFGLPASLPLVASPPFQVAGPFPSLAFGGPNSAPALASLIAPNFQHEVAAPALPLGNPFEPIHPLAPAPLVADAPPSGSASPPAPAAFKHPWSVCPDPAAKGDWLSFTLDSNAHHPSAGSRMSVQMIQQCSFSVTTYAVWSQECSLHAPQPYTLRTFPTQFDAYEWFMIVFESATGGSWLTRHEQQQSDRDGQWKLAPAGAKVVFHNQAGQANSPASVQQIHINPHRHNQRHRGANPRKKPLVPQQQQSPSIVPVSPSAPGGPAIHPALRAFQADLDHAQSSHAELVARVADLERRLRDKDDVIDRLHLAVERMRREPIPEPDSDAAVATVLSRLESENSSLKSVVAASDRENRILATKVADLQWSIEVEKSLKESRAKANAPRCFHCNHTTAENDKDNAKPQTQKEEPKVSQPTEAEPTTTPVGIAPVYSTSSVASSSSLDASSSSSSAVLVSAPLPQCVTDSASDGVTDGVTDTDMMATDATASDSAAGSHHEEDEDWSDIDDTEQDDKQQQPDTNAPQQTE